MASRNILIIRHTPENHCGPFGDVLERLGFTYSYVEAYTPPYQSESAFHERMQAEAPSGVLVLGGPQHALDDDLQAERAWLKTLVDEDIPIFGVCLGSQMLSAVLGGTVHRNRYPEVGWVSIKPTEAGANDPVFRQFAQTDTVRQFHWHNDSFTLPDGAIALASSDTCPQQAFRYGRNVLAVQFHPEVSLDVIQRWLVQSKSLSPQEKSALLAESEAALDTSKTDTPVRSSLALFEAFCRHHLMS